LQRGFPVAIALRLRNDQRKTSEQWGINKEAGKRSEVPFSRREEGRELGEEKTITSMGRISNNSEGGFSCFRFIPTNFNKYIFEGRGARYRIDIFRNQDIRLGKIHQRISLSDIKRANF